MSDNALPGYYNASVTVGDVFGAAEPFKPFFELPTSQYSERYALNTFWMPRDGVSGIHMVQVHLRLPLQLRVHVGSSLFQEGGKLLIPGVRT
jgi:hypothetical protein